MLLSPKQTTAIKYNIQFVLVVNRYRFFQFADVQDNTVADCRYTLYVWCVLKQFHHFNHIPSLWNTACQIDVSKPNAQNYL